MAEKRRRIRKSTTFLSSNRFVQECMVVDGNSALHEEDLLGEAS